MHYWEKFGFFGGHLFLDFINTYDDLGKSREEDALPDWRTVLMWSKSAGLLNDEEVRALQNEPQSPEQSQELKSLYQLRELGWRIFNKVAEAKPLAAGDINDVDEVVRWSFQHATMQKENKVYQWVAHSGSLEPVLIRIKLGLALFELLTNENLDRLSECGGCTGLFLNHGRGVGRRWCRMNTCGNRAKTNRFRGV